MTCLRCRTLRGRRLICHTPFGHWKTTTFLAGLRLNGLVAPLVVDGPINGAVFVSHVQQHLVPQMHAGDILIMDNLNSYKVAGARDVVESVGARALYLPPCSPDLNPSEQVFSKFKWLLRSAGAEL